MAQEKRNIKGKNSKLFRDRTGETFNTKDGYKVKIVDYKNNQECEYEFIHDKGKFYKTSYRTLKDEKVNYPFTPTVYNKGYLGTSLTENDFKTISVWRTMLARCYSQITQKRQPMYADKIVCNQWLNFQNFSEWFQENYVEGWQLDKDILVKGNKEYSPDNCCFVPSEINLLFTKGNSMRGKYPIGVFYDNNRFRAVVRSNGKSVYCGSHDTPEEAFKAYKIEKEKYIKEVADKWKEQLDPKVYRAMYNYNVEITD